MPEEDRDGVPGKPPQCDRFAEHDRVLATDIALHPLRAQSIA
jgi:hypothetical protein